jgi:hypothetical protein
MSRWWSTNWAGGSAGATIAWLDWEACLVGVDFANHRRWEGGYRLSVGLLVVRVDLFWGMKP